MNFRDKKIRNIVENYNELDQDGKDAVFDEIKYRGALKAAKEVNKTKTVTFRDRYAIAKERQAVFNKFEGFGTGIKYFDDATMGFRPGEVTIISGPSGFGKTMTAMNVLTAAVERALKKSMIISMEMTMDEIFTRVYNISQDHEPVKDNLIVQTELSVSPGHILAMIRRDNPDFIMIDHLQLLANQVEGRTEYERISLAIAKVKRIAIKTNKPIIVISHVSKARSGGSGEATSSDLKGASNIEQDSDIVIMLNRPKDSGVGGNEIICTLEKNRTKKPLVLKERRLITLDGIRIANNGTHSLYT